MFVILKDLNITIYWFIDLALYLCRLKSIIFTQYILPDLHHRFSFNNHLSRINAWILMHNFRFIVVLTMIYQLTYVCSGQTMSKIHELLS